MNILLTAIGKRVHLIEHLKEYNYVVGVDCGDLVPAKEFVNSFYKVPFYKDNEYVDNLIYICKREKINLLIPLYEPEFVILNKYKSKFEQIGVKILLSDKKILEICSDKEKTYEFFIKNNINTPQILGKEDLNENEKYPLIVKPRDGMGSKGVFKINNKKELMFFLDYTKDSIVQEFVDGTEYTVDVLYDLKGKLISVVPRERIEVRSGEVSKSRSVKNEKIIKSTVNLCNKLKTISKDLIGPLNIQCIIDKNKSIKFIEVNPRFGGGVPLSIASGVSYSRYFDMMIKGENINPIIGEFQELVMLRFDDAVYI